MTSRSSFGFLSPLLLTLLFLRGGIHVWLVGFWVFDEIWGIVLVFCLGNPNLLKGLLLIIFVFN